MVRLLIALRGTIARHELQRASRVPLLCAGLLGLASVAGTLALGFVQHRRADASGDIVAAVLALWLGGQLAQAALTGGNTPLRPEIFALLPLPPRRLAWSLLLVGLLDPALVLVLLACCALVPLGLHSGVAAGAVGLIAALLTAVLTGTLSVVAGGLLGPGSRRGRDLGTMITSVLLSVLALAGTLLPGVIAALEHGTTRWLTVLVRALPSGWGANAVDSVRRGDQLAASGWLAGLVVLIAITALVWPLVLRRRMSTTPRGARVAHVPSRHSLLPASASGAVCAKELRLWLRDPIRLTCLLIAAVVGLGVALVPRLTAHTGVLMPFAGPLTVVIAAACAGNLYANDGTSLWLTVVTPDSARPDVLGRQSAWLVLTAPFGTAETVLLTAFSGHPALWPAALALLVALLGAGVGLIPIASLTFVQPLDEAGNPTPGWSIKVHVALLATAILALPATAVLVLAGSSWVAWLAVPTAIATGVASGCLGHVWGVRRLQARQTDILQLLVTAS